MHRGFLLHWYLPFTRTLRLEEYHGMDGYTSDSIPARQTFLSCTHIGANQRWVTPAFFAGPVLFLASSPAQFVTAVVFPEESGYLIP